MSVFKFETAAQKKKKTISPGSRCLPFSSAGLCGRFTKLVLSLTAVIYVLLVSGMLVNHLKKERKKSNTQSRCYVFNHPYQLLIFHFLDSAHTMCPCFQIPTCFEELASSLLYIELLNSSMNYHITIIKVALCFIYI